jgi:radical SAM-linked protein
MIVLKYTKTLDARFISHIDLLKHMSRILRRANIPVKHSQGFNPHALLFFSPPTVLGVNSYAEYVAIDTDMSEREVFERYNNAVPAGLKAILSFSTAKNPNIQGKSVSADYVFDTPYFEFDYKDGFEITYKKKDDLVKEDISGKIFGIFNADGRLGVRLASGNNNLRADRLATALVEKYGVSIPITTIAKIDQYVLHDGKEMSADKYLEQTL